MTPGARVAAAIEILDRIGAGDAAEAVLTSWARRSRFAGSGDRAAVRDHVYDVLRRRRSAAAHGGGTTGRALMIGLLREADADLEKLFSGIGYAPPPLTERERGRGAPPTMRGVRLDCPDWLLPLMDRSLGADADPVLAALRRRAPIMLRTNRARAARADIQHLLAEDGIATTSHPLSPTALVVTERAGRVRGSRAYRDGLVELQDAASQAVADAVPLHPRARILDYCAGGGGKSLALAAREPAADYTAHDADPARMRDLPARAERAGVAIRTSAKAHLAPGAYDAVLVDAPCSGSGSWRRDPEGKWRLTQNALGALARLQDRILDEASAFVTPTGRLLYATCSLLKAENGDRVEAFLDRNSGWSEVDRQRLNPLDGGDGFFVAQMVRGR